VEAGSSDGREAGPVYVEKRCALPWTLMVTGLLSLAVGVIAGVVTFVLSLTVSRAIFVLTAVAVLWSLLWVRCLRTAWPTGIWVDKAGIRIGDARALRFATSQSQSVFTCPWAAVRSIAVAGRSRRRQLGWTSGAAGADRRTSIWLRLLLAPFGRAVLVLYTDGQAADAPRAELADLVDNVFSFGTPPTMWTAPTRRPNALRAALAQVPGCPPVDDHTDPAVR
jgi:hypothetical protein